MKRSLILATPFELVFGSVAFAGPKQQLPEEFIGSWCDGFYSFQWKQMIYRKEIGDNCPSGDHTKITFKKDEYDTFGDSCRYTDIKTRWDSNIIATPKTMGVTVARITARCDEAVK
jgi:hypothetical protein